VAPGTGGGPFSIFCVLCLLAERRHLLLRGLPPLSGQRTRAPAYRAMPIAVRLVMLQRRGQQRGERPRPARGRSGDGLQPGGSLPQRRRRVPDLTLGRALSCARRRSRPSSLPPSPARTPDAACRAAATSAAVSCTAFPTASGARRCAATRSARPASWGSASLAHTGCASITSCSSGPTMPGSGTTPSWIGHWPWPRAQTSPPGRTFASALRRYAASWRSPNPASLTSAATVNSTICMPASPVWMASNDLSAPSGFVALGVP